MDGGLGRAADLHLHTDRSDGRDPPALVIRRLHAAGVPVGAITDHDTIDGLPEAQAEATRLGIRLIPATELSVQYLGADIHILAYFVDVRNPELIQMLEGIRRSRALRLRELLCRLRRLGVPIQLRHVESRVPAGGPVGRPHVAEALVAAGWIGTYGDAFKYLIGNGCPAYLPNRTPSPEEALGVVLRAGGVPVLAHPDVYDLDRILDRFVGAGLMGLEVWHPGHGSEVQARLRRIADERGLLATGGSDYHGLGEGEVPPGGVAVDASVLARLEAGRDRVSDVLRRRDGANA